MYQAIELLQQFYKTMLFNDENKEQLQDILIKLMQMELKRINKIIELAAKNNEQLTYSESEAQND